MTSKIYYRSGKLNVDTDSLSRIPWEMETIRDSPLDPVLLKSTIIEPQISIKISMVPNAVIAVCELVIGTELHLTHNQWKQEQRNDYSLKRLMELLESGRLRTYNCTKDNPSDLKCMP